MYKLVQLFILYSNKSLHLNLHLNVQQFWTLLKKNLTLKNNVAMLHNKLYFTGCQFLPQIFCTCHLLVEDYSDMDTEIIWGWQFHEILLSLSIIDNDKHFPLGTND